MNLTRRKALVMGSAAVSAAILPISFAQATPEAAMALIMEFTDGSMELGDSGLELTAPEIAENGNTVPISVSAPGAVSIMVVAELNPNPGVITFNFTEMAESKAATRMRLATTQNVTAIAKMADGSFVQSTKLVKVTIGGCGG
jgi:sulfur-oxidizing protein SoxY